MRLDELTSLNDVLQSAQYIELLKKLKVDAESSIDVSRIKSQVIQSWKKGMKSRKHYDNLLSATSIKIDDLIK